MTKSRTSRRALQTLAVATLAQATGGQKLWLPSNFQEGGVNELGGGEWELQRTTNLKFSDLD